MPLEVLALGVGDTFSTKHNTTALLLRAGDEYLAIDCPDSYLKVLSQGLMKCGWPTAPADINRMVLTHVHGDHMNGLEGLGFYRHFVDRKKVLLLAVAEVKAPLWEHRLQASMGQLWDGSKFQTLSFDDYFEYEALHWEREIRVGPFSIRARRTIHHVPTSALLVSAGGRTLGYSADTAFDPTLIDFLSVADLIIHETNHGPAHTAYESLLTVDAQVRRKMRLIHYSDFFDVDASEIAVVREGEVIAV